MSCDTGFHQSCFCVIEISHIYYGVPLSFEKGQGLKSQDLTNKKRCYRCNFLIVQNL